ncbi:MAG: hypothetical protein K0U66_04830 [Gammaproteobacteria bacterium]|nr:hypothetical protein [Gammaproteobacteria bacterium]
MLNNIMGAAAPPVYPESAGHVSHHDTYIKQLWSADIIKALYDTTVLGAIANRRYEGEITKYGDTVNIRYEPDVQITTYVKGQNLRYEQPKTEKTQLFIDKGFNWGVTQDDIDRKQMDLPWMSVVTAVAAQKLQIAIDEHVLGSIHAMAHPKNTGTNAGIRTGLYNLGSQVAPVVVVARKDLPTVYKADGTAGYGTQTSATTDGTNQNPRSITRHISMIGTVLTEQNVPAMGRYIIVSPAIVELLQNSELKDTDISGDAVSMARMGWKGRIFGFDVYESQLLADATGAGATNILAGTQLALTFASQLTNTETMRVSETYGTIIRGLKVFGYKVVKPEALASSYVVPNTN